MSREASSLTVRPLFYDALSGEFEITTIAGVQNHTLARLAVAAYTKGDMLQRIPTHRNMPNTFYEHRSRAFAYNPSWANVKSVALLNGLGLLGGITLNYGESDLAVFEGQKDNRNETGLILATSSGVSFMPLVLGNPVVEARNLIADSVKEFFNAINANRS